MGNVTKLRVLRGGKTDRIANELLTTLAPILEAIKKGEVIAVALCGVSDDGSTVQAASFGDANPHLLVAAAAELAHDVVAMMASEDLPGATG